MKTTKAGLAKELQCSPGSITLLVKTGLLHPGRDGRLDRKTSLQAIAENSTGVGGGWGKESLRQRASLGERARALLERGSIRAVPKKPAKLEVRIRRNEDDSARRLADEILSHRDLVPGILAAIGVKDAVFLHCSDDVFASLVCDLAGDLCPYDWESSDDLPLLETDIQSTFDSLGLEITPKIRNAADKMADSVSDAIERAMANESK
jgi:hypothetical protein